VEGDLLGEGVETYQKDFSRKGEALNFVEDRRGKSLYTDVADRITILGMKGDPFSKKGGGAWRRGH